MEGFIAKKIPSSEEIIFPSDKLFERKPKPLVQDSQMVDGGSGDRALKANEEALQMWAEKLQDAIKKGEFGKIKRYQEIIEDLKKDKGRINIAG